ncbi:COP9 signalosome complex subunit 6-like [Sinocyclocheilus anshuiensis]|uniref:COP9 signalosome complex subunit 6-like n=1 Tax=Sinocyclocheilus anshuiensis TaxID=1608454 RepID=UPI0007B8510C|nr:PREDICTED: COP9 signalosome complex subunit 6-like [Sinocyclocheilus anshuiensis]
MAASNGGGMEVDATVVGALIGKQEGRNIEVMNSFELLFHTVEDQIHIDKEYYYTKEEQFKQVFKDMEFLGWYTTGGAPDQSDIHIHKQVCEIIESPLFLKLNPMTKHTDATMLFAELPYTLATEEAERIGVDHVARMTAIGTGENSTGTHTLTHTDFYDQCNDVGLMAYLGSITKTCNSMNQFINKFNVLYDRQGIGRRMRGLFF